MPSDIEIAEAAVIAPTKTNAELGVEQALKEYNEASDRMAVIIKYPFLVQILNNPTT